MLGRLLGLVMLSLLSLSAVFGVESMPPMIVTNGTDPTIEILPLSEARLSISQLTSIPQQPAGSFVLRNRTNIAITAAIVEWSYLTKDGARVKRGINCDGYVIGPVWLVVKPQDFSLITPNGCNERESLPRMIAAQPDINKPIPSTDDIARIDLTLDSLIFEDGTIWGPDKQRYFTKILERSTALKSFAAGAAAAQNAGEDLGSYITRIHNEARTARDRQSTWKNHYAKLLEESPNPTGTLKQLQAQPPLPRFRHIGDEQR